MKEEFFLEPEHDADEEWCRCELAAATVEGVGARLGQADVAQLLPDAPLGPIPDRAITVSHFRMGLAIIRSVSTQSKNSGSNLSLFS